MSELSPAAEAVLNAALPVYDDENLYVATMEKHAGMISAAAIKAVADQVVPYESTAPWDELKCDYDGDHWEMRQWVRTKLFNIASELEAQ